ncbi:hypothetical protein [Nonomuraea sp. NPDC050783]
MTRYLYPTRHGEATGENGLLTAGLRWTGLPPEPRIRAPVTVID